MIFKRYWSNHHLNKEPPLKITNYNTSTILAKGVYLTLDTWESNLNNNIMLVGASGRGKTRYFIKPNIMQMNSNYIISDPKGAILKEVGIMLENNGYHIKVLNLVDTEHSQGYNPFAYIRNDADIYKLIDYLIANVNPENAHYSDPFWPNSSKALISAVMFYLYKECSPSERNFSNVMKLLRAAIIKDGKEDYKSPLDIIFEDLEKKDPNHIAVMQYSIFKQAPAKTASTILTCAEVDMQYFNLDEYIQLTSKDTLDLYSLSVEKTALFVITSDTDKSKNWLAGLFYSQLFDILSHTMNKHHIRFILDDFVCTGRIPDFDYKIAMIRSRNMSCVVIQDEAQLWKEYGQATKGIISNCDCYVFLGSSNIDACNDAAHRLCESGITGPYIRKLPYSKCVVVYGNQGGIYKKYDIKKHPNYHLIADDTTSPNIYTIKNNRTIPQTSDTFQNFKMLQMRCVRENSELSKQIEHSSIKDSLLDSTEEKILYNAIRNIPNVVVFPHQHLRDIFVSGESKLSKKLGLMHCDFVIRDLQLRILIGVEIDGNQHLTDPKQMENDKTKDELFKQNSIPLLRFSAANIRNDVKSVVESILLFLETETIAKDEFWSFDDNQNF